jgi:hypothetical protein
LNTLKKKQSSWKAEVHSEFRYENGLAEDSVKWKGLVLFGIISTERQLMNPAIDAGVISITNNE